MVAGKKVLLKNKSNKNWRCSISPNSCPAVKETKKKKTLEKYGVENISQSKNNSRKRKKET